MADEQHAGTTGGPGPDLPAVTDDEMRERLGRTRDYTLIVLRTTEKFVRPDVDSIIWEHSRRNMALATAGLMPIVMPCGDDTDVAGIGVLTGTDAEVRALMDADPGVRAGIFTYEVHPVRGFPGAALPSD